MKRNTADWLTVRMLGALISLGAGIAPADFAQFKPPITDFSVTKISDGAGPGTLRQAIADVNANHGGTIRFAPGLYVGPSGWEPFEEENANAGQAGSAAG
jgi:hypothetical protein